MAENKMNRDQASGNSQQNQDLNRGNQKQNTSGQKEQDQNPQRGNQWSNYQTREMSDEGYSGKNLSGEDA